jgi:hypothetical protein
MQTFRKLPIIAPNRKTMMRMTTLLLCHIHSGPSMNPPKARAPSLTLYHPASLVFAFTLLCALCVLCVLCV